MIKYIFRIALVAMSSFMVLQDQAFALTERDARGPLCEDSCSMTSPNGDVTVCIECGANQTGDQCKQSLFEELIQDEDAVPPCPLTNGTCEDSRCKSGTCQLFLLGAPSVHGGLSTVGETTYYCGYISSSCHYTCNLLGLVY